MMLFFLNFLYLLQITQFIFFILTFLVIENVLVLFYHSVFIHWEKANLYSLANFYLSALNQYIQYRSIHTSLNCSLVFCKYLSWYFCFYEFLNFFWNMFNSKAIKTLYHCHSHINLSNEFLLIHIHYDLLHVPHLFL